MSSESDRPIYQCTAKRAIRPWLTVGGKLLVYPDYLVHRPNILEHLFFRNLRIKRIDITEVTVAPGGLSGVRTGGLAGWRTPILLSRREGERVVLIVREPTRLQELLNDPTRK